MDPNMIGQVTMPYKVEFIRRGEPRPAPGQLVVRIVSSAICGSDLHIFKGKHPSAPLPVTIGHEFSGDVAAVGEGVSAFRPGDRVTVEPVVACGVCQACRRGEYGYCENISFTYRDGDGAMARFIAVRASNAYKLPDTLSYNAGALIEPLAVAVHAVRRARPALGERVAVIGAGAIGLLITALCHQSGVRDIAVADLSANRLRLASDYGASLTINPADRDFDRAIAQWTNGAGVDKSFECVGLESTFRQAMLCLRKNGLATVLGIFEKAEIAIPATRFITHEIRVQGSQGYCWDFPAALGVAAELGLERLITHEFPLERLQDALETCLDNRSGAVKVLLHPGN